jgi:hypothetical protein
MPADCLQLFKDKNFADDLTQISEVSGKPPWQDHEFGTKAKHFSSMRWDLPRGVIVTLFAGDNCTGKCMSVWGSGEIAELRAWRMNDVLAGWAWNGVGGAASASKQVRDGLAARPKFAKSVEAVAGDSVEVFRSRDAQGDMQRLTGVTAQAHGVFHDMPTGASSLRWNLPEGVVVIFSATREGVGPNLAIWGKGQFDSVTHWQMNDRMKFYAWQSLGDD